ncbi:hypothetical protein ppKF707_0579 [Metapseudomonas furukawaii]|uniref:Uncharacterized protein n=1 Tax=Metapseudomonas furukawaii TaxID=1149133 RepID=A0AAD1BZB4_METFU|nr:hypothetical protein ppKF707_0579 [Pseudomonas furukawaii]BAU73053.1 hypothetical protein KF707C_13650 [Pseudomonas furukawaii]
MYPPPFRRAIRPWSYQTRTMVEAPGHAGAVLPFRQKKTGPCRGHGPVKHYRVVGESPGIPG